ncbi:MAG: peptidylprolyl isomerase [Candidatus Stahlbacteria bacterium]|nr:peptidylprolyl isomerase [Candidatus Stahlbacteria bacterium]
MKGLFLVLFMAGWLVADELPVAKVGEYTVTLSKFREKYKPVGDINRDSLKQIVLNDLIADRLMLIDAYAKGLDKSIADQIQPYKNRLTVGKLYDYVVISVKDKKLLPLIYRELHSGVEFAEVVRKYSTDYQAKYGGDIGEIRWGQLEPALQKVAFSLKKGEVSQPVKIRDEYRIVQLTDRKEVRGRDFAKDMDAIGESLKQKRQSELANGYLEHLRRFAHPKYNMKVIEEVSNEVSKSPDSVKTSKDKVMMSWTGGSFTVGYFLAKAANELRAGRLVGAEAIKSWLSNHLLYENLLPISASRHQFDKMPDIKQQVTQQTETLLLREYIDKEIDGKISISDDELSQYFEANQVNYGGKQVKFEQMQARVRWDVEREKKKQKREEVISELKQKVTVDINWANLKEE